MNVYIVGALGSVCLVLPFIINAVIQLRQRQLFFEIFRIYPVSKENDRRSAQLMVDEVLRGLASRLNDRTRFKEQARVGQQTLEQQLSAEKRFIESQKKFNQANKMAKKFGFIVEKKPSDYLIFLTR